jgi:hypothetical protein
MMMMMMMMFGYLHHFVASTGSHIIQLKTAFSLHSRTPLEEATAATNFPGFTGFLYGGKRPWFRLFECMGYESGPCH